MSKTKIVHGYAFNISEPYAAGHVVTEAEAKALNQVRAENIGNNLREKLKELLDAGKEAEAVALFAERDASYVFTMSSGTASRKMDPEEAEARRIAKGLIKDHLASQNRKLSTVPEGMTEDEWEAKLDAEIDRIAATPDVLKEAKKTIASKKKRSEALLAAVSGVAV